MAGVYRIERIETPSTGDVGLDCIEPEFPTQVTLLNTETLETELWIGCWDSSSGDPCTLVTLLAAGGYDLIDAPECE